MSNLSFARTYFGRNFTRYFATALACTTLNAWGCTVVGDSIAVGSANVLRQCALVGVGGINSWQWNQRYNRGVLRDDVVVISMGSNDHKHIKTRLELEKMRQSIQANRVIWILPSGNLKASEVNIEDVRAVIKSIAERNFDAVLPINYVSSDGIHPTGNGYRDIAAAVINISHQ